MASIADTVVFSESEFDPGSWSEHTPFWLHAPDDGETFSAVTDRFMTGNPIDSFMATQFVMNPQGGFNVAMAPVIMNDFVYDPGTDGEITGISASMKTMAFIGNLPSHLGAPRIYILQDGRMYTGGAADNWYAYQFDDTEHIHSFSGFSAEDFVEVNPYNGFDQDSHPDFAGSEIQFGFGLQLTTSSLEDFSDTAVSGSFDDVSVRFSTVPEPASLVLMLLGGLAVLPRK